MNNVADGLLLDVREVNITDLEFADEESALNPEFGHLTPLGEIATP